MLQILQRFWRRLRAEVVFGFLVGSIFWAAVLGWQAAYAPTDAEKQKCYDAAHDAGHKSEECKSFWEKSTSDPVAFFTLVLAVSTVGLWVATVFLYRAGEKQFRHVRRSAAIQSRDMRDSIEAANQSASAAKVAAEANKEQIELSRAVMRASLYIERFDGLALKNPDETVAVWQIRPVWENGGTTGTRWMYNHASWQAFAEGIPSGFSFPDMWDPRELNEYSVISVGPQSSLKGRTISIPTEAMIEAAEERQRIFIWGWAEYDEVFPNAPRHRTEFCAEIKVMGNPKTPDFNNFTLSFERQHNGVDEECGQRYLDAQRRRPRFISAAQTVGNITQANQ